MKLTYRGVQYDYNPPTIAATYGTSVGKYRGLDVRFRNPVKPLVLDSNLDLTYRGAAYHLGSPATAAAPVAVPVATTTVASPQVAVTTANHSEDIARNLMMRHHRNVKRRQQVMLSRLASEVGLTVDVTQYWNHIQGKVHPSFWATYDRSHVALS